MDSKRRLWVGTHGGGMPLYETSRDSFVNFAYHSTRNSLVHNDILSICEAADGKLWIGDENEGVSVYNPLDGLFLTFVTKSMIFQR